MQSIFGKCIFCRNDLTPAEMKGSGDHVIPRFLYGSLAVKDVCTRCNSKLGRTADAPSLKDPRLVAAVQALKLPELQAKLLDRAKSKFISDLDGVVVPVKYKDGHPKLVTKQSAQGVLNTDSSHSIKHLKELLAKDGYAPTEEELAEANHPELQSKIDQMNPGDSIVVAGLTVRKGSGYIHSELQTSSNACIPLVAKIGYELAFYLFDRDRMAASPVVDVLRTAAFGETQLSPEVLMYPQNKFSPITPPPGAPQYHHQLIVRYTHHANVIDIYLFGCVGFRLYLRGLSDEAHGPAEGDVRMSSIVMSFNPDEPKRKYLFRQRIGSTEVEEFVVDGVL